MTNPAGGITSAYKNCAYYSSGRETCSESGRTSQMQESTSAAPAEGVAAYIGIDWADQKHDVVLRSSSEPTKVEHSRIAHEPDALMEWLGELQQRFAGKGKILVALEQSRGA